MNRVFVSTYCVGFRHYNTLKRILQELGGTDVGAEFATIWNYHKFDELLDTQVENFRGFPATIHAPFGESCCAPGSAEYARMEVGFDKAFRWYHAFNASSMVMHTHKRSAMPEEAVQLRFQAEEVIRMMAERAWRENVNLTVENVGFRSRGSELYGQEEFIRLFDRLPWSVGALIDTGHAMLNGWDIPYVIRSLGSRIRGYHLHNNDGVEDLHRPMFADGMCYSGEQMEELLKTIARHSPNADLILEYAPGAHICTELFSQDITRMWEIMK